VLLGAALVSCQVSSGVLSAGPNTYTLTERASPILGGSMTAQRTALEKANAYCKSQDREMMPLNLQELRGLTHPDAQTGYTATFRCLLPTDPEFRR